ncbi:mitochondrial fission process protein 1 [Nilaparvata lugens]|uniref:mitochondrial fission process protein 1 n=1 Tax=Nilaparvata lugens TaxID=108931 RepID=UPI000B98A072|nr:mitochondrial fission process protein 1 [Nilaparvata lugens]
MEPAKEIDIYRDTPLRLLGYANELAEALRPVIHRYVLRTGYGVATLYMFADVADKSYAKAESCKPGDKHWIGTAIDVGIWQSLASLIVPSVFINRFGAASRYLMLRTTKLPVNRVTRISVFLSLATIPLIVKPIDKSVDLVMDTFIRDALGTKDD